MPTTRLEAFSDGVLAIIITIMVLELKIPEEPTLHAAAESATGVLTYLLSFIYIGIYWNNHHHFFAMVRHVSGAVLWANLHLLFWLSLLPFSTAWMDESHFAQLPVMVYGGNLLLCAIAWVIMQRAAVHADGSHSIVPTAIGRDLKGKLSPFLYIAGILMALLSPAVAVAMYTIVAVMWLVPDRRFERHAAVLDPEG
jgi:TMEM175 potassium channel family protein